MNRKLVLPLVGLAVIAALAIAALVGATPYNPLAFHSGSLLKAPNGVHWFGTDENGEDILSRTIVAAKSGIVLAFIGALTSGVIGVPLGLASVTARRVGPLVTRGLDLMQSFPLLVLALVLIALLGSGQVSVLYAIWLLIVPQFARLVRSRALEIKSLRYYEAAVAIGASQPRVLLIHMLPNLRSVLMTQFSLSVSQGILAIAALSYLGVGIEPPTPTWGGMIRDGTQYLVQGYWWLVVFPGAAIFVSIVVFTSLARWFGGRGQSVALRAA